MHSASMVKYLFRIRTRTGVLVENLAISGVDEACARGKLRQIYSDCEILECRSLQVSLGGRGSHLNYEDVVDLIIAS